MKNINLFSPNYFNPRKIIKEDAAKLALIHKSSFSKDHFTANFSYKLLEKYYLYLIDFHDYCLILEDKEKQIVGYLIAGKNVDIPIKKFLKENFFQVIWYMLINPKFLLEKLLESIRRSTKTNKNDSNSTISVYIIALNPKSGYKGAGKILLEEFEKILLKDNIHYYVLSVRKENKLAINFYKKNNFTQLSENHKSLVFSKKLIAD